MLRVEKIAREHPAGIILREKDLGEEEYKELGKAVMEISGRYGTNVILHNYVKAAMELGVSAIHLPLPVLRGLSKGERRQFSILGASCHSAEDALEAERLGCTYITAGHIFETDCKKGLPGRGLAFLEQVCRSVSILVYAIGGIDETKINLVKQAGAAGACVMSGAMKCQDVHSYLQNFRENGS